MHFFTLLRRPNGEFDWIKTFNTFESLIKVFGYLSGIRFILKNYVIWTNLYCSKICDCLKRGHLRSDCACARSSSPIEMNKSKRLGKGHPCICNFLLLTTKFYFQNQPPKCRVDGYKFRSVYMHNLFFFNCMYLFKSLDLNALYTQSVCLSTYSYCNTPSRGFCAAARSRKKKSVIEES